MKTPNSQQRRSSPSRELVKVDEAITALLTIFWPLDCFPAYNGSSCSLLTIAMLMLLSLYLLGERRKGNSNLALDDTSESPEADRSTTPRPVQYQQLRGTRAVILCLTDGFCFGYLGGHIAGAGWAGL